MPCDRRMYIAEDSLLRHWNKTGVYVILYPGMIRINEMEYFIWLKQKDLPR